MRCKRMVCSLAFNHSPSGSFLVLLEGPSSQHPKGKQVELTSFGDENEFIQCVVLGLSSNESIMSVIAHVLLDISGRQAPAKWISLDLSASELNAMGLGLQNRFVDAVPQN